MFLVSLFCCIVTLAIPAKLELSFRCLGRGSLNYITFEMHCFNHENQVIILTIPWTHYFCLICAIVDTKESLRSRARQQHTTRISITPRNRKFAWQKHWNPF